MASHSSTLAWKIPWVEEPGGLQSMGLLRVGHNWVSSLSCIGERNGNPFQCSCLENPRDGGAWWAAVYGVAQSWTWLNRLSSSSSMAKWKEVKNRNHELILNRWDRISLGTAIGQVLKSHWSLDVCPYGLQVHRIYRVGLNTRFCHSLF